MVRCASCRSDFFARLPEAGTDDALAAAEAGDMVPAPAAAPAPPPAPVAAPARVKKPSADDDLAAAWLAEAGLEPEPEPEPVPEPAITTPSESASEGSSAEQNALDALFEQELAAARSAAEAAEASNPALSDVPPEDGSIDKTDSKPGWRGWMARLLPGRRDRRPATGARAGKKPHPSTQQKRRGAAKGSANAGGGIGRLLKGPAAIGIASALILAALIVQRDAVVRLAPSSATLFAKLGLEVNINGLDFAEIRSTLHREGDQRFLVVEGQVISVDRRTVPVPLIEVRVSAADGSTLYSWTTEPPRANLKPGEALHFRTRLATPPEAGRHIEVRFADPAVAARART